MMNLIRKFYAAVIGGTCLGSGGGGGSKNVFLINATGAAISITIGATPYAFGIGVNGNIVVSPLDVLTNTSAAGHTFTMYQTFPGTITPGSGTPVVIGVAGVYNFPADISNYNYIRVS